MLNVITKLLEQMQEDGYIIGNGIEHTARVLSEGYAVDSIFFNGCECRVWCLDATLVTYNNRVLAQL